MRFVILTDKPARHSLWSASTTSTLGEASVPPGTDKPAPLFPDSHYGWGIEKSLPSDADGLFLGVENLVSHVVNILLLKNSLLCADDPSLLGAYNSPPPGANEPAPTRVPRTFPQILMRVLRALCRILRALIRFRNLHCCCELTRTLSHHGMLTILHHRLKYLGVIIQVSRPLQPF